LENKALDSGEIPVGEGKEEVKKDEKEEKKLKKELSKPDHRHGKDKDKEEIDERLKVMEERISKLEEENSLLKDQFLRKAAELENFRRRMFKDKEEGIKFANSLLLADLLTIIDDFERAIQSAAEAKAFEAFYQGVSLIEKQLLSMLERNWGLKRFSSAGEDFNPEKHQAIAMEASPQYDKAVVIEDYQKGYTLHDRILRPAKVKVVKPLPVETQDSEDPEKDAKKE